MDPDFSKSTDGLIPAIIQDSQTDCVLMLGYMNNEALKKTTTEKKVTFYSRSKKRLWTKGEESGNFLNVTEIIIDCDRDTLLIKARPEGPVCHTGSDTCFNEKNTPSEKSADPKNTLDFLLELQTTIQDRKKNPSDKSYTSSLFQKGINKIAQKVGEEATELVIEAKDENPGLFKNEAADLLFHYIILLAAKGVSVEEVIDVLKGRKK